MKMKKIAAATVLAGMFGFGTSAYAVSLELALLVDVSGSVNGTEYNLQKTGYVNAFNDPTIQAAIASLTGGIAVTYIEWSGSAQQSVEVGWTLITDAASAGAFATAISNSTRNFTGLTAPGSAINFATPLFSSNTFDGTRWVIDVSGDGAANDGSNTAAARDAFLLAGTNAGVSAAINGLAILTDDPNLDDWYTANIKGGAGSFVVAANDFDDFDQAVLDKIGKEIQGVPEPGALALLGIGLMGLAAARRRKLAA